MDHRRAFSRIPTRPGARLVETADFTMLKMPAAPALAGLVEDFTLYREHTTNPVRQTETASFVVPLLFGFAEPFDIALGREPGHDDAFVSFTSGLCLKSVEIRSKGRCTCLEITLTPLGARALFGLPMKELTERMIPLEALGDRPLDALRQRLGEEPDWDRRLLLAESFIVERLSRAPASAPAVHWAYDAILARGGRISVARLADRLDWSRKHLASRFRHDIGITPKAVARVARFTRAQSMARGEHAGGWADIASACGYADQAHLVREFRELAGTTPTAWLSGTLGIEDREPAV